MAGHDVIVIGGSMGAFEVLRRIVGDLEADLPAAVLVVLHTSSRSPGLLGHILDRAGPLPADLARDGEPTLPGHIYVAPPDYHLLVREGTMHLSRGPRENLTRPAIDPLFRSAAVTYRSRVIGVLLSGVLDDGTAGLSAIKRCGGLTIVQDPADAAYPEMPANAREAVDVDHTVPIYKIGSVLNRLSRDPAAEAPPLPTDLQIEAQIMGRMQDDSPSMDELGERVMLSCPDCGGTLWQLHDDKPRRYRCFIGHAYSEKSLLDGQANAADQALVVALRTLEDRARLLRKMARRDAERDFDTGRAEYEARASELEQHAEQLRQLVLGLHLS